MGIPPEITATTKTCPFTPASKNRLLGTPSALGTPIPQKVAAAKRRKRGARHFDQTRRGGPSSHKEWTASLHSGVSCVARGNLLFGSEKPKTGPSTTFRPG